VQRLTSSHLLIAGRLITETTANLIKLMLGVDAKWVVSSIFLRPPTSVY
jgi:hypothetical protein